MLAPSLSAAASPSLQVGQATTSLLIARYATSRTEQSMTRLFIHQLYTIRCTETVRIVPEEKHVRNRVPIRRLDPSTASCCFTDLSSEKAFFKANNRNSVLLPVRQKRVQATPNCERHFAIQVLELEDSLPSRHLAPETWYRPHGTKKAHRP